MGAGVARNASNYDLRAQSLQGYLYEPLFIPHLALICQSEMGQSIHSLKSSPKQILFISFQLIAAD